MRTIAAQLHLVCVSVTALLLASCSAKSVTYLNDLEAGVIYPADVRYEPSIQRNDRLSVRVSCKSPELAVPFNSPYSASVSADNGGVAASSSVNASDNPGYLVDADGNIVFPLIGPVHLEGLTLKEAAKLLRDRIVDGNYINDPSVVVEFLNFKYTVLGAVNSKGVFSVDGDRVTLIDALARAGDLAPNARMDGVCVIRQSGGERQVYTLDIRKKDIFDSPAFFLRQNDIVYVQPRYKRMDAESRTIQYVTIGTSMLSSAALIITAIMAFRGK